MTERRHQLERSYREAFARHPETHEELLEATRLAVEAIREEPWERPDEQPVSRGDTRPI